MRYLSRTTGLLWLVAALLAVTPSSFIANDAEAQETLLPSVRELFGEAKFDGGVLINWDVLYAQAVSNGAFRPAAAIDTPLGLVAVGFLGFMADRSYNTPCGWPVGSSWCGKANLWIWSRVEDTWDLTPVKASLGTSSQVVLDLLGIVSTSPGNLLQPVTVRFTTNMSLSAMPGDPRAGIVTLTSTPTGTEGTITIAGQDNELLCPPPSALSGLCVGTVSLLVDTTRLPDTGVVTFEPISGLELVPPPQGLLSRRWIEIGGFIELGPRPPSFRVVFMFTGQTFGASGGSGSVGVTAPSDRSWTASSNAAWLTIIGGSSGSGNGTVAFSVAVNASTSSRQATITVQDQVFTVTQEGTSPPPLPPQLGGRLVSFAPTNFDPTQGIYPPEESLREDLRVLRKAGFTGVVTYGSERTLQHIPRLAREEGFQVVVMGLFNIRSLEEFSNAVAAAPFVDGYSVGNEGLESPPCSQGWYGRSELEDVINRLRTATGKPVTTTEQIDDYFCDPTLLDLGDFIFPNAHPFWHNLRLPQPAAEWTAGQFEVLKGLMATRGVQKPLLFKEVGLPSAGCPECSEPNQAEYYHRLEQFKLAGRLLFSYFEAYDQPWKTSHPVEPHWGLFRFDRSPKEVVSRPMVTLALVGCVACLPGDHFMMRLGAWNPEGSAPVDFYAGALLPDGVTLVFVTSLSPLTLAVGNLSDPRTFQPLLANVSVPEGFEQVFDNVVSHTFSGGEPQGGYIAFDTLTRPGAFSDGSNDSGDILAIDLQPFSLGP